MTIRFFSHHVNYKIAGKGNISTCIKDILADHNRKVGDINIILTGDSDLLKINQKYLKRNYLTDIITFDLSNEEKLSAELYISVERVNENAKIFNVKEEDELLRIIIHGILHLCGYSDDNKKEKAKMTSMENLYLRRFYKKRSDSL